MDMRILDGLGGNGHASSANDAGRAPGMFFLRKSRSDNLALAWVAEWKRLLSLLPWEKEQCRSSKNCGATAMQRMHSL
jgi:hypothetical protein